MRIDKEIQNMKMKMCREVQKEDYSPKVYTLGESDYPYNLMEIFQRCYEQDRMLYKAYLHDHPDENHDEFIGSWMYCFTIGYVTITGYLKNFNADVFPEWDANRLYDPDDDMERRVRPHDD